MQVIPLPVCLPGRTWCWRSLKSHRTLDIHISMGLPRGIFPPCPQAVIQTRLIRRMGATERMTFASALCRVRWEYMYAMDSCEQQFQFFQETMTELIDTCFPMTTVQRHSSDKPWVTDPFRHLIRQRQRARMSGDIADLTEELSKSCSTTITSAVLPI